MTLAEIAYRLGRKALEVVANAARPGCCTGNVQAPLRAFSGHTHTLEQIVQGSVMAIPTATFGNKYEVVFTVSFRVCQTSVISNFGSPLYS